MKNSLQKEIFEDSFSNFEMKNGIHLIPSPSDFQDGKILKTLVLYKGYGIIKITVSLLILLILMIYISMISNLDPFSHIFYSFIQYLALLALILYNHTTATITPDKIIIRRILFNSLVLRKEDIMQTLLSKSKSHLYRWLLRLSFFVVLTIQLFQITESITRDLQMGAVSAFVKLNAVMADFWIVAYVLVIYYIFELTVPYQQILRVTTRSNLNLEFYTKNSEDLMSIFESENKKS